MLHTLSFSWKAYSRFGERIFSIFLIVVDQGVGRSAGAAVSSIGFDNFVEKSVTHPTQAMRRGEKGGGGEEEEEKGRGGGRKRKRRRRGGGGGGGNMVVM
jgi:hypothetical protein